MPFLGLWNPKGNEERLKIESEPLDQTISASLDKILSLPTLLLHLSAVSLTHFTLGWCLTGVEHWFSSAPSPRTHEVKRFWYPVQSVKTASKAH